MYIPATMIANSKTIISATVLYVTVCQYTSTWRILCAGGGVGGVGGRRGSIGVCVVTEIGAAVALTLQFNTAFRACTKSGLPRTQLTNSVSAAFWSKGGRRI